MSSRKEAVWMVLDAFGSLAHELGASIEGGIEDAVAALLSLGVSDDELVDNSGPYVNEVRLELGKTDPAPEENS